MAKSPTRVQQIESLKTQNSLDESTIECSQQRISTRNQEILAIQQDIVEELKAAGGAPTTIIPVGGIASCHDLCEGDLIVAQGSTWAGSVLGTVVVFKELSGSNDIRAWTDHKRSATDYGRGFLFLARPVEVKK